MRKFVRFIASTTAVAVTALFTTISFYNQAISDHYFVPQGDTLSISPIISSREIEVVSASETISYNSKTVDLDLFGIIPIKQTKVSEVAEIKLVPGGTPFGIKLLTAGVLVVGLNSIATEDGMVNPAKDAGLSVGDTILSINGKSVSSNSEISEIVQESQGNELAVEFSRNGDTQTLIVTPVISKTDQKAKVGIWVRDSSAGIGTVTFYNPANGLFAGLGHAVCDVDTGDILPISYGEVVPATISGVTKGSVGSAGSLIGMFTSDEQLGEVLYNTQCGIFGTLDDNQDIYGDAIPMAFKQDVHTGTAAILSTVDGDKPKEYEIEIQEINTDDATMTKNMIIKVTDQDLLDKTGGIVQGMSGSPIIQDGKLVGAVTHVFVNDPTKGYGIFAENMIYTVQNLMQEDLQKAS